MLPMLRCRYRAMLYMHLALNDAPYSIQAAFLVPIKKFPDTKPEKSLLFSDAFFPAFRVMLHFQSHKPLIAQGLLSSGCKIPCILPDKQGTIGRWVIARLLPQPFFNKRSQVLCSKKFFLS
jgi:hypothetical protein